MYRVMGANEWRSAPSLQAIPVEPRAFFPAGNGRTATSTSAAGGFLAQAPRPTTVTYRYDPANRNKATLGTWVAGDFALHAADLRALAGDGFVFESNLFEAPVESIGQPSFVAALRVEAPYADFRPRLYEIRADGSSVYLSEARLRARYRHSMSAPEFSASGRPKIYRYARFSFAARRLEADSGPRFVVDAPNSIYVQRNYNAAKPVADQTPEDARSTTVTTNLGGKAPAMLTVPLRKIADGP